jgi:hypothetical protein
VVAGPPPDAAEQAGRPAVALRPDEGDDHRAEDRADQHDVTEDMPEPAETAEDADHRVVDDPQPGRREMAARTRH